MDAGEAIITGQLMATVEDEIQSAQITLDGGIVALMIVASLAGHRASSNLVLFYISCLRVGPLVRHMVNRGTS